MSHNGIGIFLPRYEREYKEFMEILIAKIIIKLMKLFKFGATTFPGRVALKLNHKVLGRLSKGVKVIIITGTNGKTTSARIIEEGIKRTGKTYFINRSGANLITGITTSFIENSTVSGKCKKEYAIIECDENAFVNVSKYIKAEVILVTNVFRDQLDRYGEVNHTLSVIKTSVDNLPNATLVINGDCSLTNTLYRDNTVTFGVSVPRNQESSVRDGMYCSNCKSKLTYDYYTYAHLGKYECEKCGYKRRDPDFEVTDVFEETENSSTVIINNEITAKINLGGFYNIYNALGSYAALVTAGVDSNIALEALANFGGAFGRMEDFDNGRISIILVKNPAGLNQTCDFVDLHQGDKTVIFSLNDNAADGRDVSWIWDADIKAKGKVYTYGKRSYDMALRLKYAGIKTENCDDIIETCKNTSGKIFIIPTYTSMMAMRPLFTKEFGGKEFWK